MVNLIKTKPISNLQKSKPERTREIILLKFILMIRKFLMFKTLNSKRKQIWLQTLLMTNPPLKYGSLTKMKKLLFQTPPEPGASLERTSSNLLQNSAINPKVKPSYHQLITLKVALLQLIVHLLLPKEVLILPILLPRPQPLITL